ncbi:MAG: histone deacetylase family protein, partial [Pseudomonadota bacterium]|nr:histone deacetylase family protein [Pseudomonadota bacterium]
MALAYYTHCDMLGHQPGGRHPERPERLAAVIEALADASDLDLDRREAPLIERADLAAVHGEGFIAAIFGASPAAGLRA